MTPLQRNEALAACDRILASHARAHSLISDGLKGLIEAFDEMARICQQPKERATMKPQQRFTIGEQPCANFLRGDADIAALGEGNRRNLHQCPKCEGNRAWCDNCHTDHHDGGWETCKPGAYVEPIED